MCETEEIESLTKRIFANLDGSGSVEEREVIDNLREIVSSPAEILSRVYDQSTNWKVRSSCIYYLFRDARTDSIAVNLALKGIKDRSRVVRYRACMLLAISLDSDALPLLKEALDQSKDEQTRSDIEAAIDAIEAQNSHYFIDREHTGKTKLRIKGVIDG